VRSFANNTDNMDELIEVVEYIDKKIEEFRFRRGRDEKEN